MSLPPAGRALLCSGALLLPLAVPLVPGLPLPPGLFFALTYGRWLVVLGALATAWTLTRPPQAPPLPRWRTPPWPLRWPALWLAAFAVFVAMVPEHRWNGTSLVGDEPKYLRMADSLYRDLDVDVGSGRQDAPELRANLHALGDALREAGTDLVSPPGGARSTNRNWSIEGQHGGRYYVQSPGLPLLLLPAVALQRGLDAQNPRPWLPLLLLGMLWATAVLQAARLGSELRAPTGAAALAAMLVLASPPLLIGGMHFYPEVVAVALVPWAARVVRPGAPAPSSLRATLLAAALGALPAFHPKFLPLALVLAVLLLWRLRAHPRALVLAALAGLLPFLALLLFDRHVTGLLRPDAFYVVYGSDVYQGAGTLVSARIATGLVNGLFAARDGLLVMAPVTIAGVLALPLLWRRSHRDALALAAAFGAIWFAAAVHDGGAPGPPARLMAPAAALLAVPLALALRDRGTSLPYRWTAVALALVTLAMTASFRADWLRTVNPYRALPAEANFAPDLPDGPRDLSVTPPESRRFPDIVRGVVLLITLAIFSLLLFPSRPHPAAPSPWPPIAYLHLSWWLTIVSLAVFFHTLP